MCCVVLRVGQSRVQCALRYEPLGADARQQVCVCLCVWREVAGIIGCCEPAHQRDENSRGGKVWTNLLSARGVATTDGGGGGGGIDTRILASHALNGRQIKNAVQLGLALAKRDGVWVWV